MKDSNKENTPADTVTGSSGFWQDFEKPNDDQLQQQLTDLQYKVTQRDGTERAYSEGNYNDEKRDGIYVDIVSGEPLYASIHKYDSGTGWPSFYQSIAPENLVTKTDYKLIYPRTEVRSKYADSHLGHIFSDGPEPSGQRHCINGAALRFVPRDTMEAEGYAQYLELFEN